MAYLGNNHNHATLVGAGGGGYLGLAACLAAGIYPLGQMQGGGANVLRVETARQAFTANAGWQTVDCTWTNDFVGGAIIGAVLTLESVTDKAGNWMMHSFNTTYARMRCQWEADGYAVAIGIGYD